MTDKERRRGPRKKLKEAYKFSTIVEREEFVWLEAYAERNKISMAEAARKAINLLREDDHKDKQS